MATISIRDGFVQAPHEWLASLLRARLTDDQAIIAFEVIAQVKGLGRLESASLSPADIARRAGKCASNIRKAITQMVAKRMLVSLGCQRYRPSDDYESWEVSQETEHRWP